MMMEKKNLRKDGQVSSKEPEKSQFRPRPFAAQEDENEGPDLEAPGSGSRFGFLSGDLCPSAMKTVQCKMALEQGDDRYEREADGMARRFMSSLSSSEWLGKPAGTGLMTAPGGTSLKPDLASAIQQSRGQGQPLPYGVRQPMERAFGTDFNAVRVHEDGHADSLSRSLGARAFTTGKDVFFRNAAYRPGSSEGRRLLAHELTHVVQQSRNKGIIQRSIEQPVAPIANSAIVNKAVERSGGAIGPAYNYNPGWWYSPNTDLAGWRPHPSPQEERQGAQNPPPAGEGIVNWSVVPTCNLFVYDVLYAAGLNPPLQSNRHYYSAPQTYSRSGPLRSYFGLVRDPSAVQPGDVMANGVHLEIVISSIRGNRFDAIGAHSDGAYQKAKTYDNSLRFLRRVVLGDFNIPSREGRLA